MRFVILCGVIAATAVAFYPLTETDEAGVSKSAEVLEMPALCVMSEDEPCWLTLGGGVGVLVIGAGGIGIVVFGLYGAGVLFATGQLAVGCIAFGQVGIGPVMWVGQAGGGFVAGGQVAIGIIASGQGQVGFDGESFFDALKKDIDHIFRFRGPLSG